MSLTPQDQRAERWWLPFLIPGILGVALVTALALTRGSAIGHEDARAFLDAIPPFEVEEGDVVYTRTENYLRFGPKADVIERESGFVSERFTQEFWVRVGPNQTLTHTLTRRADERGSVYEESWRTPQEYRSIDPRTGEVLDARSGSVTEVVDSTRASVKNFQNMLDDGRARVVSLTDTMLTLELRFSRSDLGNATFEDDASFSVPYWADLDMRELVDRLTINNEGIVIERTSVARINGDHEVLVSSERVTIEILDEMPMPLAGGAGQ